MNARNVGAIAVSASLVLVAMACSNGSVTEEGGAPDAGSSTPIPAEAGGPSAEPPDASDASRDADAAERVCTDEGWCHTVVPDAQTLRSVWSDGQGSAWAVTEQGNILRWDGTAWVQSHAAGVPLYAVWGSSPTDLWAGGGAPTTGDQASPGTLLHGTGPSPSTIAWEAVAAPAAVRSIWGTSATDVWAIASVPERFRTDDPSFVLHYSGPAGAGDAGSEWKVDPVSNEFPSYFQKAWGTSKDDIWVTGRVAGDFASVQGRLYHRRPDGEGGFVWRIDQPTPLNDWTPIPAVLDGISVSPSMVFLIQLSSYSGDLLYHKGISNDDGATFTWTERPTSETGFTYNAVSTIWGSSPDDVWLAGSLGRLRHWDGAKWRAAEVSLDGLPVQKAIHAIWGSGPDDVWAVGQDVALHKGAPGK